MANFKEYTDAVLYIDGKQQVEAQSVKVAFMGNHNVVKTMALGKSGTSKGASETKISVSAAVPSAGFEFDFTESVNSASIHELTVFAAGKTLTLKGWFDSGELNKATDSEASVSFEFEGGPSQWE